MKKIFASLPMAGKSYAEIRKGQESLLRKAKDILGEPVELIESLFTDAPNGSAPLWYLARSLELLSSADYVILVPAVGIIGAYVVTIVVMIICLVLIKVNHS